MGLSFVFDTQVLEGRISETDAYAGVDKGLVVPIDRTVVGVKSNLMPSRNDVLGLNLSQ